MTDAVRELRDVWADLASGIEITRGEDDPGAKAFRHCIRDLYRALEPQAAPEVCRWKPDEDSGLYAVGCYPGIIRNVDNFTYCPDCGRKIEVCHE